MAIDLAKIHDSDHLLDLLVAVEDVLDSTDSYVFKGVFDGEVIEGPIVRRYWVTVGLLYKELPDPRFALRLLRSGIQVEFDRMQRDSEAPAPGEKKAPPSRGEWVVRISIPRRLLDQNEEMDLEEYEEEVNSDDVESAKDTGLDDESSLHTDEQDPNAPPGPGGPGAPPPPPPAG